MPHPRIPPARLRVALALALALAVRPAALAAQEDPYVKPMPVLNDGGGATTTGTGPRPVGLSASVNRGSRFLPVSWTGTSGERTATLLRASSAGGSYAVIRTDDYSKQAVATTRSLMDEHAVAGATSYYKVRVVYPDGTWGLSDALRVDVPPWPAGVRDLKATSPARGTVTLQWTADPEASGYNIGRSKGTEPRVMIRENPPHTGTTFTDTGLWDGAAYTYVVYPVYAAPRTLGASAWVNVTVAP